jgi:hypothetical protein
MKKLNSFLWLPAQQKYLLAKAALVLCTIRLALWLVPFRVLRGLVLKAGTRTAGNDRQTSYSIDRVSWALDLCSRHLAAPTCLTQALAAMLLLKHAGHEADLRIGVAKDEGGKLQAHAWVESNGEIVVGAITGLSHFTILSSPNEDHL